MIADVLTVQTSVGELAHNAVYKVPVSRREDVHDKRLADSLVRMVQLNLRVAPILGDLESDLRLCFTSGKMLVYCNALRRRHLMNCLLFFIVLFRLSSWHLCVSKRPRVAIREAIVLPKVCLLKSV